MDIEEMKTDADRLMGGILSEMCSKYGIENWEMIIALMQNWATEVMIESLINVKEM